MANTYKLLGKTETSQSTIAISNKALTSNVATITTSAAHNLVVGQTVSVVMDAADDGFDGVHVVVSTPTTTTFTFDSVHSDITSAAATGDVTGFEWETLYTCPSATAAVLSSITVTNKNDFGAYYQVAISDTTSVSGEDYIVYNDIMAGYETVSLTIGITLDAVQKNLLVNASSANITFNAFGMEVT